MSPGATVFRRPSNSSAVSGRWPGLSPVMAQAAQKVMSNKTPDPNKFFTRPHVFFHRVDYAAVGQTSLNLFNVSPAPSVCNLPVQGTIQQETFFKLEHIRVIPQTGIAGANAYTRVAAGSQIAAAVTPLTVGEELRTILEGGSLTINVGDKRICDSIYGLTKFPAGGGLNFNSALSGTAAAAEVIHFNNGTPDSGNGFMFRPGFAILPGKPISGQLTWQAALAVTTLFVLRVELCGLLVSPSNN